jgi:hypothetical protein
VLATPDTLRALRDKYLEIKRLRVEHEAGGAADPRREMAALAQRFPGALRELDELPMPEIEQRLAQLDAVVERAAEVPEWARLQISYHGLLRVALRIKRVAQGRALADADRVLAELREWYEPAADEPALASLDRAAVAEILEPPGGRLNPWVFARVAALHGVEPDRVHRALFLRQTGVAGGRAPD